MPFALIIIAVMLVTVGLRGTQADLYCLVKADFTGQNNFFYWLAAVLLIGSIGYVDKLRPVSDAFLLLLVVALFLASKGGVFTNLAQAFSQTSATATVVTPTATTTATTTADPLASALPSLSSLLGMRSSIPT